ncbi:acetyltransferase [Pseudomonas sp. MAFF 302030]|uniref:Acetyltransferase n=1 Tax=Pseudomonas morbosilactucae TaxID=2938197 RepID=A0A9X2CAK7_9PSED|nr:GNAT family N-acetyltransferase [Pseudomonas morbosilactucae]MCK9802340.1 acetyltransferase [Pseudomonas morbosilactucae]
MNSPSFSLALADGRQATAQDETPESGSLRIDGGDLIAYREVDGRILFDNFPETLPASALLALLATRFCHRSKCEQVTLLLPVSREYAVSAVRQGLFDHWQNTENGQVELRCLRQTFWQQPLPWLTAPASAHTPPIYRFTGEKRHPQRPPQPTGDVYRRWLPRLNTTFSLRTIDPVKDLEAFNRWMNLEQVAYFWEQSGSLEEHAEYLHAMLQDPRVHPLIGCFDDEPFAYFEVYWCKEDRIAPYYDVADFDRGWHVVVGENKHQGIGKLRAWFRSLMHYMFLDDPRTQRILGEPRIDHNRQIDFLKSQGFGHLKDIQLAHKKAALLRLEREAFFDDHAL